MKTGIPISRRLAEWLFPGVVWQTEQWGKVTRSRSFLGGLITMEVVSEMVEHGPDGHK